ncbi:WcaI family glycosyltransferase [Mucilaginibacter terrae]|uniref:Colanic acid biosynthesis glycosyl transferase WcaI n=1 Tax=Mucilaginibacter terrae TaxID=1955052 RepID=A0ABU3GS76_9SPHI|nr:WcaI family glycosyltransferase [Mucilaginibacter terrae]MDT3402616.1 colanic acid biosynthesis glycosyl transferase WcaI [Mucilaginibacter terrae]
MKNEKILLISHNFSPEPTGIGKYNGEMIEWLSKQGYECTVITTFPYYPYWKVQAPYTNRWYKKEVIVMGEKGAPVTVYRCPSFIPKNPTGKKRMIQDMSFWLFKIWVVFKMLLSSNKFDLIITVAPPFHLAYLGLLIRNYKGGKLLYHIQDLQIEAAQDLQMLSSNKLIDRLYTIERDILAKADFVSTISEGMKDKVSVKVDKPVHFFPNWADTTYFYPVDNRGSLKSKWGYQDTDLIFLYSGAIGEKQGLENVIHAADLLKKESDIKFIICGSGPYKDKLVKMAEEKGLNSINFLPVQDKEVFNEFLNLGDFHLVLQKANAGDLVMPSKLTTILAVGGTSIVTCSPGTSLYNVVDKYDLGYIIEPESYEALANVILRIKENPEGALVKRHNARDYALQYLNIDNVMENFVGDFLPKPEIKEAINN